MEELVTEVKKANHQQQARHQEQKAMLKETLMEQCQQNSLLHVEMALACRTRLWVSSTTLNRFILKITESDDVEAFFFAPHKGKVGRGNTLANLIAAFIIGHAQQPRKERKFKLLYRKTLVIFRYSKSQIQNLQFWQMYLFPRNMIGHIIWSERKLNSLFTQIWVCLLVSL